MTKLEDMSEPERQSWITFLADGAVFIYLWTAMTQGLSPRPIYSKMSEFGPIIVGVIVWTVILHTVISIVFETRRRKTSYKKDERDAIIERQGALWGYRILTVGIAFLIIALIINSSIAEVTGTEPFDLGDSPIERLIASLTSIRTPAEIIFTLMALTYVADLIKHGVMLKAYRS